MIQQNITCQATVGTTDTLSIPYCIAWNNQANTVPICVSASNAAAGTGSKCRCAVLTVPNVVVQGAQLEVQMGAVPACFDTTVTVRFRVIVGPGQDIKDVVFDSVPDTLADSFLCCASTFTDWTCATPVATTSFLKGKTYYCFDTITGQTDTFNLQIKASGKGLLDNAAVTDTSDTTVEVKHASDYCSTACKCLTAYCPASGSSACTFKYAGLTINTADYCVTTGCS
jgi:hypothetical protein